MTYHIIIWSTLRSLTIIFFVFKQKTAYEMRISDWSSDVCSSDLYSTARETSSRALARGMTGFAVTSPCVASHGHEGLGNIRHRPARWEKCSCASFMSRSRSTPVKGSTYVMPSMVKSDRSEEHTSELQSLMRNSYAVFCLKKTKKK